MLACDHQHHCSLCSPTRATPWRLADYENGGYKGKGGERKEGKKKKKRGEKEKKRKEKKGKKEKKERKEAIEQHFEATMAL